MPLLELKSKVKRQGRKRVGRGNASGHGTYSCRGQKGQSSRSGGRRKAGFEGGQTPLSRKMPKLKGFKNINRIEFKAINVGDLEKLYDAGEVNLTNSKTPVKLLGDGEVSKAFKVTVDKASKSAIEKIKKAGGSCEVLAPSNAEAKAEAKKPAEEKPAEEPKQ